MQLNEDFGSNTNFQKSTKIFKKSIISLKPQLANVTSSFEATRFAYYRQGPLRVNGDAVFEALIRMFNTAQLTIFFYNRQPVPNFY